MPGKLVTWLEGKLPFLFRDQMPVWLTIVASIAVAVATYYIAPSVNRRFQLDDARAAHLTQTTQGLNSEIIELSQKVRRLNSALVNESTSAAIVREECLDAVTKLQWRLVDLRVVLTTPEDRQGIERLETALEGVKAALDRAVDARSQQHLLKAMHTLAREARDTLDRLYKTAHLK